MSPQKQTATPAPTEDCTRLQQCFTFTCLFSFLVYSAPMRIDGMSVLQTAKFIAWGHIHVNPGLPLQWIGLPPLIYGLIKATQRGILAGICGIVLWCGGGWLLSIVYTSVW